MSILSTYTWFRLSRNSIKAYTFKDICIHFGLHVRMHSIVSSKPKKIFSNAISLLQSSIGWSNVIENHFFSREIQHFCVRSSVGVCASVTYWLSLDCFCRCCSKRLQSFFFMIGTIYLAIFSASFEGYHQFG